MQEGKVAEVAGLHDEAYEKYCNGLHHLLEVMPKLDERDPTAASLRSKISGYLETAENLKTRLEGSGRGSRSRRRDGGDGDKGVKRRSSDDPMAVRKHGKMHKHRHRSDRKSRSRDRHR